MKCPECGIKAKILETRTRPDGVIRRRYKCLNEHLFTSLEALVEISETQLHPKYKTVTPSRKPRMSGMWFPTFPSSAH